jgi:hypothetical protein
MPIAALQYDANGRLAGMTMDDQNGNGPQPFANATYTAAGQLYQLSYGIGTETRTYNSLMQLTNQSIPGVLTPPRRTTAGSRVQSTVSRDRTLLTPTTG